MSNTSQILRRADRLLDADMVIMRQDFKALANSASGGFAGAVGGSNHRDYVRKLCATELHARVRLALDKLWEAHDAMSGPLWDSCSTAYKDWIAAHAHDATKDLGQYRVTSPPGYEDAGQSEVAAGYLLHEQDGEITSANAEIDNRFDVSWLQRVNQWIRWSIRAIRVAVTALVRWLFSGAGAAG
jgi:hypothetical protein